MRSVTFTALSLLFLWVPGAAQQAPHAVTFSFEGGLNLRDDPRAVPPTFAVGNTYNVDFLPTGVAAMRKGTNLDAASTIPNGLQTFDAGHVFLDESGLYVDGQLTSVLLGSALKDSTVAAYYNLDSISVASYGSRIFVSAVHTSASLACDVWVFDQRYNTWARQSGWKPKTWGTWKLSTHRDYQLFWADRTNTAKVFHYDEALTADEDTAGASAAITCEVFTPVFSTPGFSTRWQTVYVTMDTKDSVRVSVIGSTRYGDTFEYTLLALSSTVQADTTVARYPRTWKISVMNPTVGGQGLEAETLQVHFWARGTRFVLYPGAVVGERRPL